MAGQRQPIELVQAKGRKHLTKAEIAERQAQELHAKSDKVAPPKWLTKDEKKRFRYLASQLMELKVMTNLDCVSLALHVRTEAELIDLNERLLGEDTNTLERKGLLELREKLWKQYNKGNTEFGLTPAARCRIAAPREKESKPENKFLKYAKGKAEA